MISGEIKPLGGAGAPSPPLDPHLFMHARNWIGACLCDWPILSRRDERATLVRSLFHHHRKENNTAKIAIPTQLIWNRRYQFGFGFIAVQNVSYKSGEL